jgi:O-antigen/teichoic acid export membrane protein
VRRFFQQRTRLSSILVYGIANAMPGATSAVLLVLYTRVFRLGEFGRYGVLTAIIAVIGIIADLGMPAAILRNYYDRHHKEGEAREYVSSIVAGYRFVMLCVLPLVGVALYFIWPLVGMSVKLVLATIAILLSISYFERSGELLGAVCRATEKPSYFLIGRVANAVANILAAVVIVLMLHGGVTGALLARLVGCFVLWVTFHLIMAMKLGIGGGRLRWPELRACLSFGLPFVPTRLAGWAQRLALRPMLAKLVPLRSVGLFTVASGIANVPTLVTAAFDFALAPIYYKRRAEGGKTFIETIEGLGRTFLGGQFALWAIFILFTREIVELAAGARYAGAVPSCALLFCAASARCLNPFVMRQLQFLKQTWLLPIVTIPCGALSLAITIIFCGRYGIFAAAWALLISEVVLLTALTVVIRFFERSHLSLSRMLLLLASLLILAIWVCVGEPVPAGLPGVVVKLGVAIAIAIMSFALSIWPNRVLLLRLASG